MTAGEVYVDPSVLSRLYLHQAGSREIAAWRAKVKGTRSLDVLHVASALELASRFFLTFDLRQQPLAAATGLRTVHLEFGKSEKQ